MNGDEDGLGIYFWERLMISIIWGWLRMNRIDYLGFQDRLAGDEALSIGIRVKTNGLSKLET